METLKSFKKTLDSHEKPWYTKVVEGNNRWTEGSSGN